MELGYYRHFKGNIYKVTSVAKHSETQEAMVVYHDAQNPEQAWVRPLPEWNETVERDGEVVQRFSLIK